MFTDEIILKLVYENNNEIILKLIHGISVRELLKLGEASTGEGKLL